jgi:peptidoglycan hydrolase CwlO-like protein
MPTEPIANVLPAWAQILLAAITAGGIIDRTFAHFTRRARLAAATAKGEQAAAEKLRAELFAIVDRQQAQIDAQAKKIEGLETDRQRLSEENTALKTRCQHLEGEIVDLRRRLNRKEDRPGNPGLVQT